MPRKNIYECDYGQDAPLTFAHAELHGTTIGRPCSARVSCGGNAYCHQKKCVELCFPTQHHHAHEITRDSSGKCDYKGMP